MSYEQVRDILDHLNKLHQQLHDYYEGLSRSCTKARLKMLLDYLGEHESLTQRQLKEYMDSADRSTLETYFSFTPDRDRWEMIQKLHITNDSSVSDVIDAILTVDDSLMSIFSEIIDNSESEKVRSLFKDVHKNTCDLRKKMVRNVMMIEEC